MTRYNILFLSMLFIINTGLVNAQKNNGNRVVELYEDNDLLLMINGTDRYYTNGTRIGYHYLKNVKKFKIWDKALIGFKNDTVAQLSWGLMQIMFTPENLSEYSLQKGDWPYAGGLFISHSKYSVNKRNNMGIKSEYLIGVIGPWSFAAETQTFVHKVINSTPPNGWKWQIDNYPILNYNLSIEPKLIISKYADAVGSFEVNVGSLLNQIKSGLKFRLGIKKGYYSNKPKKTQVYLNYNINGCFVLYSAYLEGGFFDKKKYEEGISKGYRINESEISRLYLESQLGINIKYKDFGVSYSIKYRTRQTIETNALLIGNITAYIPFYKN